MDVLSNNLANISTTGYKKDNITVESFRNVLLTRVNGSNETNEGPVNGVTSQKGDGYVIGHTDNGYFRVLTEDGIDNGKDIMFHVDAEGYLSTFYRNSDRIIDERPGYRVLDREGKAIQLGTDVKDLDIDQNGNLLADGQTVTNLVKEVAPQVIGTINGGVKGTRVLTSFDQGQLSRTDNKLDVALQGDGFFIVNTSEGQFLTRNGNFTINSQGRLVTMEGYPVEGQNGPITIASENVVINEFGEIMENGQAIDKIQTVAYSNKSDVSKIGGSYYRERSKIYGEKGPADAEVVQGFLEASNADSIEEMIKLIELSRNYESGQKVVNTIDEMISKAVNEVGRI